MATFKVALLQISPDRDHPETNLNVGEENCRKAKDMGADIALFPEMWNIGYQSCPLDDAGRKIWVAQAIPQNGSFISHFTQLAKTLNMAILLTYLENSAGNLKNSASLIDRHGAILTTYSKVHTCDFGMEAVLTPGDDFYVCDLDTLQGAVRIGIMICYDREFPESARVLMLKGAEIILIPNACVLEENRMGQLRSRAFENMCGVATANYPAPIANGHSCAFDGMAFGQDESSRNTKLVEAGESQGIIMAEFDLDQLRDYRRRETWGNAYRKPYAYQTLVSTEVQAPFVRTDAKRRG
jgi:predicted amidohydrolase